MVDLEGKGEEEVPVRAELVRKVIKAVVPCDVNSDPPIPLQYVDEYDVVTEFLCLVSACATREDYVAALVRLVGKALHSVAYTLKITHSFINTGMVMIRLTDTKPYLYIFLHYSSSVIKMQGWDFVYLPSLLYHTQLVCILFGMPPLHCFTFHKIRFVAPRVSSFSLVAHHHHIKVSFLIGQEYLQYMQINGFAVG